MAYTLNNAETDDNYNADNTLSCPGTVRLRIQVYNNAIFYQLGRGAQAQVHPDDEFFLGPVPVSLDVVCDSVQVRSAAAGAPADVTIQALTPGDLPAGEDGG